MINLCFQFFHIGTFFELEERIINARNVDDEKSVFEIEQLILHKACISYSESNLSHNTLRIYYILGRWIAKYDYSVWLPPLWSAILDCIYLDKAPALRKVISTVNTHDSSIIGISLTHLIDIGIDFNALQSVAYLFEHKGKACWMNEKSPDILLNAINRHHENADFIQFIIDQLAAAGASGFFIAHKTSCDDIMTKIIEHDLIGIAKSIIRLRWHNITTNDMIFARFTNERNSSSKSLCYQYFTDRSNQKHHAEMVNNTCIQLEDDGWYTTENIDGEVKRHCTNDAENEHKYSENDSDNNSNEHANSNNSNASIETKRKAMENMQEFSKNVEWTYEIDDLVQHIHNKHGSSGAQVMERKLINGMKKYKIRCIGNSCDEWVGENQIFIISSKAKKIPNTPPSLK